MRTTLKLVLCGALLALAVASAQGSDPIALPAVGLSRPPQEVSNLGWLFPDLDPVADSWVMQTGPSVATPMRDDSVMRTQIPEGPLNYPGRMPSSRPRTRRPAPAAPTVAPPMAAPGAEMTALPPSRAPWPSPPQPAPAGNGPDPTASPQTFAVNPSASALGRMLDSANLASPAPVQPGAVVDGSTVDDLWFDIAPPMIGDQAPLSLRSFLTPAAPGRPPVPPAPSLRQRLGIAVPWARGFKIADNMSPRPMDRLFFTFNYFNNLDGSINNRIAPGVGGMEAYRYLFGYEKTFWNGNASIGLRLPLDTLSINGQGSGLGGTSTALGNLTVFSKLILLQQQRTGNLLSGGLAITAPTGPASFGGAQGTFGYRDAQFQPFLGYYWARNRFYVQGFEAIDVPTDPHDVTMQYNDIGIGYYTYRNADPRAFSSAIAPTFETHVNVPLNHVGAFRGFDPAGTPDVVDLTFGVNVLFRQRSMLTFGFINPVTGPRPFSEEWTILFNYFFGRTRRTPPSPTPPVVGL